VLRSRGLSRWLVRFDDEATTWVSSREPDILARHQHLRRGDRVRTVLIRRGQKKLEISSEAKGRSSSRIQRLAENDAPIVDLQTLLLSLRGWEPDMGKRTHFLFLAETRVWDAKMEYHGLRTVTVAGERQKAYRFDGRMKLLGKSGEGATGPTRGFTIWLSADRERLPIKFAAETSDATIRGVLVDYTPAPTLVQNGGRAR
jgi:hypothetical protein